MGNNPVNLNDPSGQFGVIGAAFGGGLQLLREVGSGGFRNPGAAISRIAASATFGTIQSSVLPVHSSSYSLLLTLLIA